MTSESSIKAYVSTIRSAARKVEHLNMEFGTPIDPRMIFGLFGWEVEHRYR